jgi:hypothetical protein
VGREDVRLAPGAGSPDAQLPVEIPSGNEEFAVRAVGEGGGGHAPGGSRHRNEGSLERLRALIAELKSQPAISKARWDLSGLNKLHDALRLKNKAPSFGKKNEVKMLMEFVRDVPASECGRIHQILSRSRGAPTPAAGGNGASLPAEDRGRSVLKGAPAEKPIPSFGFQFVDRDGVVVWTGRYGRIEGEVLCKTGNAFRLVLDLPARDVIDETVQVKVKVEP